MFATVKDERIADKVEIAILLNLRDGEGFENFNTFTFETLENKEIYSKVLIKFEKYCSNGRMSFTIAIIFFVYPKIKTNN